MKKLSALYIVLLSALLLFSASPAWALDAAEAQKLKSLFEQYLNRQAKDLGEHGELVREGEVMVEMADNFYAITMPHLTVKNADGTTTEIGIIAINAVPAEDPELWKMSVALPTPITVYDQDGKPGLVIHTGKQNAAGIWHEKLANFVKLKAQYQDIFVTGQDGKFQINVPEAQVTYGLEKDAEGLWSGPLAFSFKGFDMKLPDGASIKLESGLTKVQLYDYDLDAAYDYRQQLAALSESYDAGEESKNPEHMKALYSLVSDFIGKIWDGFMMENTVKDIKVTLTEPANRTISLAEVGFDFGLTGFRQNSVTLRLAINYEDLAAIPLPAEFDETAPHSLTIDIAIQKLPFEDIRDVGMTAITSASQMPKMAQMAALQALFSLPEILTKAGTSVEINRIHAANDMYSLDGKGSVTTDSNAAKGAVGKGQMQIQGLEKLLAASNAKLKDPALAAEDKAKLEDRIAKLTTLQMAGQQGTNDKGNPVRLYNFELTPDGQFLLNGSDLMILLGGNTDPAEATPAP